MPNRSIRFHPFIRGLIPLALFQAGFDRSDDAGRMIPIALPGPIRYIVPGFA